MGLKAGARRTATGASVMEMSASVAGTPLTASGVIFELSMSRIGCGAAWSDMSRGVYGQLRDVTRFGSCRCELQNRGRWKSIAGPTLISHFKRDRAVTGFRV